jgi:hypothetical protein
MEKPIEKALKISVNKMGINVLSHNSYTKKGETFFVGDYFLIFTFG